MGMATERYSFQVQGELWSKVVVGLTLTILDIVVLVGGQKLEEVKTVGQWWGRPVRITCLEVSLNDGKGTERSVVLRSARPTENADAKTSVIFALNSAQINRHRY
jgi:hypothetical protein